MRVPAEFSICQWVWRNKSRQGEERPYCCRLGQVLRPIHSSNAILQEFSPSSIVLLSPEVLKLRYFAGMLGDVRWPLTGGGNGASNQKGHLAADTLFFPQGG